MSPMTKMVIRSNSLMGLAASKFFGSADQNTRVFIRKIFIRQ